MLKSTDCLHGAVTAMVTPFTNDGIDEVGFIENIHFQLDFGIDGLLVLGSTGEASTLTPAEQQQVIAIAKREIGDRVPLWVGTGSYCTRQTIEKTIRARDLGADIALVVTPYYNRPTQEGLYRHFEAVAHASPLPIVVYNIPGRCGTNIETSTLLRIAALPNIVGIKEAAGNINQVSDIMEIIVKRYPHFKVFAGDDIMTLPMMSLGAVGVVTITANIAPEPLIALVRACQSKDFVSTRHLHSLLYPIFKASIIETNPIPMKAMMNMAGLAAGHCRLPLCELNENHQEPLREIVTKLGLLKECLQ